MTFRPHARPRPAKRRKKKKKDPETADEYLDAGVEQEESGDRWRPGDKPKAGRFYGRAIENYSAALARNPRLYDAVYNKARLQYYLSQNAECLPLARQSSESTNALLVAALQTHRQCLALDPENEDALFNAGQVLCSLAEALVEHRAAAAETKPDAIRHLDEAITLLSKCLAVQEAQYSTFSSHREAPPSSSFNASPPPPPDQNDVPMGEADDNDEDTADGGVSLTEHNGDNDGDSDSDAMDSDSPPGSRAVIQRPVTPSQILDTALAALAAHTTLLPLLSSDPAALATAHASAESLLAHKLLPLAASLPDTAAEVFLARANHACALAEARFRAGAQDLAAWEAAVKAAYPDDNNNNNNNSNNNDCTNANTTWNWRSSAQAHCEKADAHSALAAAAAESSLPAQAWRQYALSSSCLSAAAKLEPSKAEIHLARGDTEMLRSRVEADAAAKSRAVLLRNAGVYYRGAKRLAEAAGETVGIGGIGGGNGGGGGREKVRLEAEVKEALVAAESGGDVTAIRELAGRWGVNEIVREACEEGVFGTEWADRVDAWKREKGLR